MIAPGQRLRTALRRDLKVRLSGGRAGSRVPVRAMGGDQAVASGSGRAGTTVVMRFTAKAKRALARRASVRATLVTSGARTQITVPR